MSEATTTNAYLLHRRSRLIANDALLRNLGLLPPSMAETTSTLGIELSTQPHRIMEGAIEVTSPSVSTTEVVDSNDGDGDQGASTEGSKRKRRKRYQVPENTVKRRSSRKAAPMKLFMKEDFSRKSVYERQRRMLCKRSACLHIQEFSSDESSALDLLKNLTSRKEISKTPMQVEKGTVLAVAWQAYFLEPTSTTNDPPESSSCASESSDLSDEEDEEEIDEIEEHLYDAAKAIEEKERSVTTSENEKLGEGERNVSDESSKQQPDAPLVENRDLEIDDMPPRDRDSESSPSVWAPLQQTHEPAPMLMFSGPATHSIPPPPPPRPMIITHPLTTYVSDGYSAPMVPPPPPRVVVAANRPFILSATGQTGAIPHMYHATHAQPQYQSVFHNAYVPVPPPPPPRNVHGSYPPPHHLQSPQHLVYQVPISIPPPPPMQRELRLSPLLNNHVSSLSPPPPPPPPPHREESPVRNAPTPPPPPHREQSPIRNAPTSPAPPAPVPPPPRLEEVSSTGSSLSIESTQSLVPSPLKSTQVPPRTSPAKKPRGRIVGPSRYLRRFHLDLPAMKDFYATLVSLASKGNEHLYDVRDCLEVIVPAKRASSKKTKGMLNWTVPAWLPLGTYKLEMGSRRLDIFAVSQDITVVEAVGNLDETNVGVWCVCGNTDARQDYTGSWVSCSQCCAWQHWACYTRISAARNATQPPQLRQSSSHQQLPQQQTVSFSGVLERVIEPEVPADDDDDATSQKDDMFILERRRLSKKERQEKTEALAARVSHVHLLVPDVLPTPEEDFLCWGCQPLPRLNDKEESEEKTISVTALGDRVELMVNMIGAASGGYSRKQQIAPGLDNLSRLCVTPNHVVKFLRTLIDPQTDKTCADLGAGTGSFSGALPQGSLCVEIDELRYDEGRAAKPEMTWLHMDVLDPAFFRDSRFGKFDLVISNPDFEVGLQFIFIGLCLIRNACLSCRVESANPKNENSGRLIFLLPSDFFEASNLRSRIFKLLDFHIETEFKLGHLCYYSRKAPGAQKLTCDSLFVLRPGRGPAKYEHRVVNARLAGML